MTRLSTTLLIALLACNGDKEKEHSGEPTAPVEYQPLAEGLPSALLSVTGTSAADVWAIGSDADGTGPHVLHYDGTAWSREDVGSPGDLWWAWLPGNGEVWIAGAGGRVVQYTPGSGSAVETTAPEVTLFGLWGSSPTDVWAVGGNIQLPNGAAVFHSDGTSWEAVPLPAEAQAVTAMYKVWGVSADDVWISGAGGITIHWDGSAWSNVPTPTTAPLYTVDGSSSSDVWAVGGGGNGVALHWDGSAWTDVSPGFASTLQGVDGAADPAIVVGWAGGVYEDEGGALVEDPRGRATFSDLHAVWVDPDGGAWMVGGDLSTLTAGTLVYSGPATPQPYAD